MNDLLQYETPLRLGALLTILGGMMLWEQLAPARPSSQAQGRRWFANLAMGVLDALVLRFSLPVVAVGVALVAEQRGWGLLNWLGWPAWVALLSSVLLLDLAVYGQHLLMHKLPMLWRLHRMHHSDMDFDASTALRFHPLEIVLSMLFKMLLVLALGVPPAAVLVFELILNGMALFNHGNVRLRRGLEQCLRWVLVTPDVHRVHHSVLMKETNSNFGFNLSCWDRVFGTYRPHPLGGHQGMTLGLNEFRDRRRLSLPWLLLQPFLDSAPRRRQNVPASEA